MTSSDWLTVVTILAILFSPLIALQVSVCLEKRREASTRRVNIFKTLMATRFTRLAPQHVEALNMIELEYYGKDTASKEVVAAWRKYYEHLSIDYSKMEEAEQQEAQKKRDTLFQNLLDKMADCLNYRFDVTQLADPSYYPQMFVNIELQNLYIRSRLADILAGTAELPVIIRAPEEQMRAQNQMREYFTDYITGKAKPIKVTIVEDPEDRIAELLPKT